MAKRIIDQRSTRPSDSAVTILTLKAEQRVHDEAAIGLMREAQKHLRAATKIDREIGKLIDPKEAAHAA